MDSMSAPLASQLSLFRTHRRLFCFEQTPHRRGDRGKYIPNALGTAGDSVSLPILCFLITYDRQRSKISQLPAKKGQIGLFGMRPFRDLQIGNLRPGRNDLWNTCFAAYGMPGGHVNRTDLILIY